MYYTAPSEDFSRPGRTWYPTLGKTRFPLWREVSICYHEGVPGHHLQIAQVSLPVGPAQPLPAAGGLHLRPRRGVGPVRRAPHGRARLSRRSRPSSWACSSAQAMRAVRVIVDIGMHLELPIPADERYHPGERWTAELALPFVIERSCFPADFMASEVDRYLGLPGPSHLLQGRRTGVARGPASRQGPKGGRVRPQRLPPLRPRSRRHGPRSARPGAAAVLSRPPGEAVSPPGRAAGEVGDERSPGLTS